MILRPLLVIVLVMVSTAANATLINRGNGLVYDTINNLTWTQNASISENPINPGNTRDLPDSLAWVFDLNYAGIGNWQLPDIGQLAILYAELGAYAPGIHRTGNQGPFTGIQRFYWSDTMFVPSGPGQPAAGSNSWIYDFEYSGQYVSGMQGVHGYYAWPVAVGDVGKIPSPDSLSLLAFAIGWLATAHILQKKSAGKLLLRRRCQ